MHPARTAVLRDVLIEKMGEEAPAVHIAPIELLGDVIVGKVAKGSNVMILEIKWSEVEGPTSGSCHLAN